MMQFSIVYAKIGTGPQETISVNENQYPLVEGGKIEFKRSPLAKPETGYIDLIKDMGDYNLYYISQL